MAVRLKGEVEAQLLMWVAGWRVKREEEGWATSGRGREQTESG